jgi:P-type conjugative transfer protein TrbJ
MTGIVINREPKCYFQVVLIFGLMIGTAVWFVWQALRDLYGSLRYGLLSKATVRIITSALITAVALHFPAGCAMAQIPPFAVPTAPAGAGVPVFDAAAEATRLQQLQLEQQNTYAGSAGVWQPNQQFLDSLGALIKQQTGLSYSDPQLIQIFEQLYPGYSIQQGAPTPQDSVQTNLNTLNGTLQDAQAQAQSWQGEQTTLAGLEVDNQSAVGNLQVSQTGNEIALIRVQQQQTIRQLIMALLNSYNVNSAAAVNAQTASQLTAMALVGAPPQVLTLAPPGPPIAVISAGGQEQ